MKGKMEFKKYQHIERFGTTEVNNISDGVCYVFPKIDGTNASVWLGDDGIIKAGSRNRELTLDNDNAGFYEWVLQQESFVKFFKAFPLIRLFGEWLVPHSLKTYREDAWRKFYVFDVCFISEYDELNYKKYEDYQPALEIYGLDYIPPLRIVKKGTYETFVGLLEKNDFLIKDGLGAGEGIVIKNYDYISSHGNTVWAKIVTSAFKETNHKEMGAPLINGKTLVEEQIAEKYVTKGRVDKLYNKIEVEKAGFKAENIFHLLNGMYYEIVKDESWDIVKEFKNPTINYNTLKHFVFAKTKEHRRELFGL